MNKHEGRPRAEVQSTNSTLPAEEYLGSPSDPRSLRNLLPKSLVNAAMTLREEDLDRNDRDLLQKITPWARTEIRRLREGLWIACHQALSSGRKMSEQEIFYGVVSKGVFKKHLEHPERVAFMLRPPSNYQTFMQEALHFAVDQIRDILDQDHMDPKTGKLDPKIADVKRRIFVDVADRVKGMPVQRTENLNYNKEVGANQSFGEAAMPVDAADIDRKIKELEKDMGEIKDVTPDEK